MSVMRSMVRQRARGSGIHHKGLTSFCSGIKVMPTETTVPEGQPGIDYVDVTTSADRKRKYRKIYPKKS